VLPIAPPTYHDHVAKRCDPARLSARARRDAALKVEVRRVFEENFSVYGMRKVWRQFQREGHDVAPRGAQLRETLWKNAPMTGVAEQAERTASRIAGALLLALAAYVVVSVGWKFWTRQGAEFSLPGLIVTVLAVPIMYCLSRSKLRIAERAR